MSAAVINSKKYLKAGKSKGVKPVQGHTGSFTLEPDGVFYTGFNKDRLLAQAKFICATLRILGETRNTQSIDWGRLLEWQDNEGKVHRWAMPMALLANDGWDVVRELLRRGLIIAPGQNKKVLEYIQSFKSNQRFTCTDKTGWHNDVFVLPDCVYGENADSWIYQQDNGIELTISQQGSLADWQKNVAKPSKGNSRLIFSISAAFAGSLAHLSNTESGGFHFYGDSSCGKSTAQIVAASVWGAPEAYKRSWRATSNGLESIASLHNDGFLILDEIREISSKDASETAYMLSNGQGKTRSDRNGSARKAKAWRLIFLSSGEVTLKDMLQSEGQRVYAGQEVRIADIPADAGANMGLFECVHEFSDPAQLANHLRHVSNHYYGLAGQVWLKIITQNISQIQSTLGTTIKQFVDEVAPNASGQVYRVAQRFGLVASAGELASTYGITGWHVGEANDAAKRCFKDWLQGFGQGKREDRQILGAVQAFLERNSAKFLNIKHKAPLPINDMLGYFDKTESSFKYVILASQFERVCCGFNIKKVIQVLNAAGWLDGPDAQGVSSRKMRLTIGQKRVYSLTIKET